MFDLMGAIRQKQNKITPLDADSADAAETTQQSAYEPAESVREPAEGLTSATIRTCTQMQKPGNIPATLAYSDSSANPQNPQTITIENHCYADALLMDIAHTIRANPACLRAELDEFDIKLIRDGRLTRNSLINYFKLLRRDGKNLHTLAKKVTSHVS